MDNKSVIPAGRTIAKSIELVELPADTSANKPAFGTQLELIQNVKVSLSALIGRCEMTVAELFALKEGAVVPLDRDTREPVDLRQAHEMQLQLLGPIRPEPAKAHDQ